MAFNLSGWWQGGKSEPEVKPVTRPPARRKVVNPYHAVGIKTSPGCCAGARDLRGRRFLSAEAPKVPLKDCDVAACSCVYAHYDDRRSGKERRVRGSAPATERRLGRGRREADH